MCVCVCVSECVGVCVRLCNIAHIVTLLRFTTEKSTTTCGGIENDGFCYGIFYRRRQHEFCIRLRVCNLFWELWSQIVCLFVRLPLNGVSASEAHTYDGGLWELVHISSLIVAFRLLLWYAGNCTKWLREFSLILVNWNRIITRMSSTKSSKNSMMYGNTHCSGNFLCTASRSIFASHIVGLHVASYDPLWFYGNMVKWWEHFIWVRWFLKRAHYRMRGTASMCTFWK